jgi:hypothetical protein
VRASKSGEYCSPSATICASFSGGASASMLTHANQLHSPTMKLKRKAISETFNRIIDARYNE